MKMGFRARMKKRRSNLGRRTKQQSSTKDKRGRLATIFKKDSIPEGVEFWKCNEGEHLIDILPWFAGDNMPLDDFGNPVSKKGQDDYVLDLFVHTYIGSMKEPFICPYENFGEPCPICEHMKANFIDDKDLYDKLRPKRRTVYLIWVHDSREEEKKGVQIWEVAHYFMEAELSELAKLPRGGGVVEFAHADEGKSIAFNKKGKGKTGIKFSAYKFIDRDEEIPDRILDKTFPVDSIVNMHPSYKAIEKAFKSTMSSYVPADEEQEEEEAPRKRKRSLSRRKKHAGSKTRSSTRHARKRTNSKTDSTSKSKRKSAGKTRRKKKRVTPDDVPF
jgi:hypothetical protein